MIDLDKVKNQKQLWFECDSIARVSDVALMYFPTEKRGSFIIMHKFQKIRRECEGNDFILFALPFDNISLE